MEYPRKGAIFSCLSEGKVKVLISFFEDGLSLPTTEFLNELMRQYGFHIDDLTPNTFNKIVGLELVYWTLGVLPQFWEFKAFFNSSTQSGAWTFPQR